MPFVKPREGPSPHARPALDTEWEEPYRRRAARGDREAMGELLRRYQARVFGFVVRLVGRPAEACEVTQEVFVQALRAQHRLDPRRPFRPWLFKIALNVCRNHRRAGARREQAKPIPERADALWRQADASAEERVQARQQEQQVECYLLRLTEKDRELLLLRFVEDNGYRDLAAIYGLPVSVLKMRVHRAIRRLRVVAERHR